MTTNLCSLSKTIGCQGTISQRGNIMCDKCMDDRKNISKIRRDQNIDDLFTQNKEVERELLRAREKYQTILKDLEDLKTSSDNKILSMTGEIADLRTRLSTDHIADYNVQLEKENRRLSDVIIKLRTDIESLVKDKAEYEMTYAQIHLDNEKIIVDNGRLQKTNKDLNEQNELLMKENELKIK